MSLARPASNRRSLPASGAVSGRALTSGNRPRQSARTSTASRAGSSPTSGSNGAPSRVSAQKVGGRLQRPARPPAVQHGPAPQPHSLVEGSVSPVTPPTYKAKEAGLEACAVWEGHRPPDARGGRLCDVGLLRVAERRARAASTETEDALWPRAVRGPLDIKKVD